MMMMTMMMIKLLIKVDVVIDWVCCWCCVQRTPVDVARLDEFGAQLYLGPMAPVHSAGRSPATIIAYQLHMLRSGWSFVSAP